MSLTHDQKHYYLRFLLMLTIGYLPVTLSGAKPLSRVYFVNTGSVRLESMLKAQISWQIHTDEQNLMQTAYEIRVTESTDRFITKASWFGIRKKLILINR